MYWRGVFIFQGLKKIHTLTHGHDYNLSISSYVIYVIYISYYKSILNIGSEKQDTTKCADQQIQKLEYIKKGKGPGKLKSLFNRNVY